ncbi:Aste57867_17532 [Aphanomyces stellatus]|uniref:Aste57867_17532 protein n=1 Tax=Aphanomyces stellatus TaxID=120398 RepID=A0A485L8Q4_9STRA|nr:hypothetical protein As57867_017472 [Aphanomyces stellatus]VFT94285.1 Aste57867_17532 [Aphanomyces stellatus]
MSRSAKHSRQDSDVTTSSVASVLLSPDLMASIAQFQPSTYIDLHFFAKLHQSPNYFLKYKCDNIHAALSAWLTANADLRRLPKLCACSASMASIVMWHAIKSADFALLGALHTKIDRQMFVWNFIDIAATTNNLDVLSYLHEHRHAGCTSDALDHAIRQGNLAMLSALHQHHPTVGYRNSALQAAVKRGHVAVVTFLALHHLHSKAPCGCGRRQAAILFDDVAFKGHVELLPYLRLLGWRGSPAGLSRAVRQNRLDVVELLYEGMPCGNAIQTAADVGRLDILTWLHDHVPNDYNQESMKMDPTAANGHLDVLQYLHTHGATCTTEAMDLAAENGRWEVVQWLHQHRTEGCTIRTLQAAANQGNLDLLRCLYSHYSHIQALLNMVIVAANGHAEVLQFLHDHGATCTTDAMDLAAGNGHLDVFRWLERKRKEGCTAKAMDLAAGGNHEAMVTYLFESALVDPICTSHAMDSAAAGGHLDMLKWLHKHTTAGCTTDAMDRAAAAGHWVVVMWLFENCSVGGTELAPCLAAENGHLDLSKWLMETRKIPCSLDVASKVASIAANCGDVKFLAWLAVEYPQVVTSSLLQAAVAGGHKVAVTWGLDNIQGVCPGCVVRAAKGNIAIVFVLAMAPQRRCQQCATRQARTKDSVDVNVAVVEDQTKLAYVATD